MGYGELRKNLYKCIENTWTNGESTDIKCIQLYSIDSINDTHVKTNITVSTSGNTYYLYTILENGNLQIYSQTRGKHNNTSSNGKFYIHLYETEIILQSEEVINSITTTTEIISGYLPSISISPSETTSNDTIKDSIDLSGNSYYDNYNNHNYEFVTNKAIADKATITSDSIEITKEANLPDGSVFNTENATIPELISNNISVTQSQTIGDLKNTGYFHVYGKSENPVVSIVGTNSDGTIPAVGRVNIFKNSTPAITLDGNSSNININDTTKGAQAITLDGNSSNITINNTAKGAPATITLNGNSSNIKIKDNNNTIDMLATSTSHSPYIGLYTNSNSDNNSHRRIILAGTVDNSETGNGKNSGYLSISGTVGNVDVHSAKLRALPNNHDALLELGYVGDEANTIAGNICLLGDNDNLPKIKGLNASNTEIPIEIRNINSSVINLTNYIKINSNNSDYVINSISDSKISNAVSNRIKAERAEKPIYEIYGNILPEDNKPYGVLKLFSNGSNTINLDGQSGTIRSNFIKTDNLLWSQSNGVITGDLSPIGMGINSDNNANRLAFINPNAIIIKSFTDNQDQADDYFTYFKYKEDQINSVKIMHVTGRHPLTVNNASEPSRKLQMTINFCPEDNVHYLYTSLKKLMIHVENANDSYLYAKIEYKRGNGDWTVQYEMCPLMGWTGWNEINLNGIGTLGNEVGDALRITYWSGVAPTGSERSFILGIRLYGVNLWTSSNSYMANTGHLYDYDSNQTAIFPANLVVGKKTNMSYITLNGTSERLPIVAGHDESNNHIPIIIPKLNVTESLQIPDDLVFDTFKSKNLYLESDSGRTVTLSVSDESPNAGCLTSDHSIYAPFIRTEYAYTNPQMYKVSYKILGPIDEDDVGKNNITQEHVGMEEIVRYGKYDSSGKETDEITTRLLVDYDTYKVYEYSNSLNEWILVYRISWNLSARGRTYTIKSNTINFNQYTIFVLRLKDGCSWTNNVKTDLTSDRFDIYSGTSDNALILDYNYASKKIYLHFNTFSRNIGMYAENPFVDFGNGFTGLRFLPRDRYFRTEQKNTEIDTFGGFATGYGNDVTLIGNDSTGDIISAFFNGGYVSDWVVKKFSSYQGGSPTFNNLYSKNIITDGSISASEFDGGTFNGKFEGTFEGTHLGYTVPDDDPLVGEVLLSGGAGMNSIICGQYGASVLNDGDKMNTNQFLPAWFRGLVVGNPGGDRVILGRGNDTCLCSYFLNTNGDSNVQYYRSYEDGTPKFDYLKNKYYEVKRGKTAMTHPNNAHEGIYKFVPMAIGLSPADGEDELHNVQPEERINLINEIVNKVQDGTFAATIHYGPAQGVFGYVVSKASLVGCISMQYDAGGERLEISGYSKYWGYNDITKKLTQVPIEFTDPIIAPSFNATSDKRLKTNIKDFTPSKSILDLPIKEFDFKKTGEHTIGCLAQDLREICPEIVKGKETEDDYLTIQESKIVYLLLDELKKLRKEFDDYKKSNDKRYDDLLKRIEMLEDRE